VNRIDLQCIWPSKQSGERYAARIQMIDDSRIGLK